MTFSDIVSDVEKGLVEKRELIDEWFESVPEVEHELVLGPAGEEGLRAHLHVIDTSLEKAEEGTLGVCVVCHGRVEDELLEMDYTSCICLDHYSPAERRQLESELELSQVVQRGLLPQTFPSIDGVELAAFSRPAQIVGGGYFDFLRFRDGAHGVVLADIGGHGVSAGMLMSSLQTAFHTLVPEAIAPEEVLQRINRLYVHNVNFTTFITIFFGRLDPRTRTLTYASAGHNPPLLYRRGRAIERLQPARPLADGGSRCEPTGRALGKRRLLLYTDGVTEATNRRDEFFGMDRLEQVIRENHTLPAEGLVRAVRRALDEFSEGRVLDDDTTLVSFALT
jgi:sigma-B regulation protein RsbU (phosphoserine phosphatase)